MAISEPRQNLDRRAALSSASIVAGLLLVALSILLPNKILAGSAWSVEQAQEYQTAALRMHTLSHSAIHASPEKKQQLRQQLQDAEKDYASRRAELDAALARPRRTTTTLRVVGVALAAAGVLSAYIRRNAA